MTDDRATAYALAVTAGEIVAGPHVRDACARHLRDIQEGPGRGLFWDAEESARAIGFFEDCLCLNGGQYEGKPFLLLPWQDFVVGSIFGWKQKNSTGPRRFRVAYIETGKGSGKSPIAAAIGIKGMVADGESRAEIYAAATHRDQAKILFRDALAFYDQSPELQKRLVASGNGDNRWNLSYPDKGSFFRVISSESKGKSGPRPHMALLDEIHEHADRSVIEMLRAGFKFRRQPLSVMITNSGCNKQTVCWEYHEMGAKIAAGTLENDEFFAYICAMDPEDIEGDRFLDDPDCWVKVNPSLDAGIPGMEYIKGQVCEAQGMPGKMATVKRLNFCIWTEAENPWILPEVWFGCEDQEWIPDAALMKRRCWGGLDLGSTQDLTCLALMFEPIESDPVWRLLLRFWMPNDTLTQREKQDRVPYVAWRNAGYLEALPGRAVDKSAVLKRLHEVSGQFDLQSIAYDRWRIEDLKMLADREGVEMCLGELVDGTWEFKTPGIRMRPYGQGFKDMAPALDKFETMLLNREMRHNGNPVLTWNAANAVAVSDPAGNRKVAKDKSTGRVDGIVAAIMATGIIETAGVVGSVYESRGVRVI